MLTRTDIQADLDAIRDLVAGLEPLFKSNRLCVTARPGAPDPLYDGDGWLPAGETEAGFTEITEPFRGTAVEALLHSLPCRYGRVRLMRMAPKSCLTFHSDESTRLHLAITTNPACYMIERDGDHGYFYHIPADGFVYHADTRLFHSAMNCSTESRIHLVIANLDVVGAPASRFDGQSKAIPTRALVDA
jgi:hypothetical protein